MMLFLKVRVARSLCHPAVGRIVAHLFGGVVPNRGCRIDTRNSAISPTVVASIFWRLYESAECRFVAKYLPRDLDVVELGASLGAVSAQIGRRIDPGRRLICVEANPTLLELVARNVRFNAPHVSPEVVHAAISYGVSQTVRFAVAVENIDSALASTESAGPVIEVPALSLGKLLELRGIGDFALVSDIEGAEAQILRCDVSALDHCRFIIIELHATRDEGRPVNVEELRARVEAAGFRLLDRRGPVCAFERCR